MNTLAQINTEAANDQERRSRPIIKAHKTGSNKPKTKRIFANREAINEAYAKYQTRKKLAVLKRQEEQAATLKLMMSVAGGRKGHFKLGDVAAALNIKRKPEPVLTLSVSKETWKDIHKRGIHRNALFTLPVE